MLSKDRKQVKISDYGLSKIKIETPSGAVVGDPTVRWRAPETFTREYARVKDTLSTQEALDSYAMGPVEKAKSGASSDDMLEEIRSGTVKLNPVKPRIPKTPHK